METLPEILVSLYKDGRISGDVAAAVLASASFVASITPERAADLGIGSQWTETLSRFMA